LSGSKFHHQQTNIQCFDTVGWATGRASGLQKDWMLQSDSLLQNNSFKAQFSSKTMQQYNRMTLNRAQATHTQSPTHFKPCNLISRCIHLHQSQLNLASVTLNEYLFSCQIQPVFNRFLAFNELNKS